MTDAEDHLMTVFTAALDRGTAPERVAYLDRACAGNPGLRGRVEALLRADAKAGHFLGVPADPAETASFVPASAPGGQPAGRVFDEELRVLLRSRLLLVHLLLLVYVVLLGVLSVLVPSDGRTDSATRPDGGNPLTLIVPLVTCLLGIIVLWRIRGISLPAMRWWELTFFAIFAADNGYSRFEALTRIRDTADLSVAVGFQGLASLQGFVTLILAYGVFVPNTRRRSLLVVAAICAVAFATVLPAAAVNPALHGGHVPALIAQCALSLTFPAAIAVFAASRATALQRRAFDAERRAARLGQYTLRRKIGAGGMGEVWLAEHGLLKRPCAVKFIRPELAAHPATAARFAREVQAVTSLTHPNTVRVYDYGRAEDGSFYFVMEYLDGPTLDELVRRSGPLQPGRVVDLLRQVCGALAEAHACGLIHRDLKPGNIIVAALGGRAGVAKLLDFGLVQDLSAESNDRLTRAGTVLGTPEFMSPEQAAGEASLDARSDVYSLGVVAFFALAGRPPFQGKSVGQVLASHRSEPPPSLAVADAGVPADLAAVVARCLAKDPNERFQSMAEVDRALERCASAGDGPAERATGLREGHPTSVSGV